MITKIEGIVTDIVRHSDTHNVVTLYTRQLGRMAFLVPVGKSKAGRMRNAAMAYCAVLSASVNVRPGKELYSCRQFEPLRLWPDIYSNPLKGSVIFFITEFLSKLLRQYPADPVLWDYIVSSLEVLENSNVARIANFHIAFLVRLLSITGVEPQPGCWQTGDRFDMLSGEFIGSGVREFMRRRMLLDEVESAVVSSLLRMNFRNMHYFRFSRETRNVVLARLISYYSVHFSLNPDFRSLHVLHDLFS